jgi:hypothetical protein
VAGVKAQVEVKTVPPAAALRMIGLLGLGWRLVTASRSTRQAALSATLRSCHDPPVPAG